MFVVLLACVACGKSKSPDPAAGSGSATAVASGSAVATGSGSGSAAPIGKDAPPCPQGDALTARVAELFGVKREAVDSADCVVGHFPQPGWVIAARYTSKDSADEGPTVEDRTVVVDAAGKIIASEADEVPVGALDSSGSDEYQAVDLDGDGTDELVSVFGTDKRGYMMKGLIVQRLANQKWDTILTRQFEYDNSAAEPESGVLSCDATWKIEAAGADKKRAIVFDPKTKPPKKAKATADECVLAKETWTIGADGKYAKK